MERAHLLVLRRNLFHLLMILGIIKDGISRWMRRLASTTHPHRSKRHSQRPHLHPNPQHAQPHPHARHTILLPLPQAIRTPHHLHVRPTTVPLLVSPPHIILLLSLMLGKEGPTPLHHHHHQVKSRHLQPGDAEDHQPRLRMVQ